MSPKPNEEGVRANTMIPAQTQVPNLAIAALRVDVDRIAAEQRQLLHRVHELTVHVQALEHTVRSLLACAVQQHWDGRLYLPAQRVTLDFTVNGYPAAVHAVARTTMEPPVRSALPLSHGAGLPAPLGSSTPAPPPGMSLPTSLGWQSIANANALDDPLGDR